MARVHLFVAVICLIVAGLAFGRGILDEDRTEVLLAGVLAVLGTANLILWRS